MVRPLSVGLANHLEIRHTVTSFPQLFTDVLQEAVSAQRISAFLQRPDVQYLDESESTATIAEADQPLVVAGDIAWAVPQENIDLSSAPFVLRDLDITFERGTITLIAGKFGCGKSLLLNALLGEVALLRGRISYAVSAVADPWQTETAVDWDHCFEGLAFVPQVGLAAYDVTLADLQTAWLQSLSVR
jgi:ABC-type multidrug transport system fused ATPase/permease subunit